MPLPRIYNDEKCPLEGYESLIFRMLQNPTSAEWSDMTEGDSTTPEGRERYGRAFHVFYGQSAVEGFDFSTPEAALETISRKDLPDELIYWLSTLPLARVQQRREAIEKKLWPSLTSPS